MIAKFKVYESYVDSGVESIGYIPEGWSVNRLKDVCIVNPSKSEVKLAEDTEVTFLPMESILSVGKIDASIAKEFSEVAGGYTYFREGDIIIAKVTPCFENGNIALVKGLINGIGFGTTELHVIRATPRCDSRFIFYLVQSKRFKLEGIASMYGVAGLKRIPADFVANFKFAMPSIAEQIRIADFLDQKTNEVDAIIADKNALIAQLEEHRKVIIAQTVTKGLNPNAQTKWSGVNWIGEVPRLWTVCKINYRYSIELGKMLDEKRIVGNSLVPYLRNQDVQWGSINSADLPEMDISETERDRYTVKSGDLLVCEGGDVGRAAIWRGNDNEIGFQKALHRVRPRNKEEDTAEFLYFVLVAAKHSGAFNENDSKATISHLTGEKFRQYRFAFPSIDEQLEIARKLADDTREINGLIQELKQSVALLHEYRQSLIFEAVTGKIDVRETVVESTVV